MLATEKIRPEELVSCLRICRKQLEGLSARGWTSLNQELELELMKEIMAMKMKGVRPGFVRQQLIDEAFGEGTWDKLCQTEMRLP